MARFDMMVESVFTGAGLPPLKVGARATVEIGEDLPALRFASNPPAGSPISARSRRSAASPANISARHLTVGPVGVGGGLW